MDYLKTLRSFVNVVACGSLSAAARQEGVAPAMVSRRLDALEARLGVKLLQRTTRRIALTPEGASFVEDCQRLLRELADAEAAVAARGVEATGHLRVTAPAGFGRKFVAPIVADYSRQYPRMTVALDLTDRLVDLVAEGFDCAIRFGEQADSALVRIPLGYSRRVVVAAPVYLSGYGQPRHPRDLEQHLCLSLGDGLAAEQRGWMLTIDGVATVQRVGGALTCNDGAVLHEWALQGRGLAWRSLWEVAEDLQAGRLVSVLDMHTAPPTPVYGVFPARKYMPTRLRAFLEQLKATFARPALQAALSGTMNF